MKPVIVFSGCATSLFLNSLVEDFSLCVFQYHTTITVRQAWVVSHTLAYRKLALIER